MTLQELQNQLLQLPINDRWHLVQSILSSIQQETLLPRKTKTNKDSFANLDPWTQGLIGVIQLNEIEPIDSYVDYLEEKYN